MKSFIDAIQVLSPFQTQADIKEALQILNKPEAEFIDSDLIGQVRKKLNNVLNKNEAHADAVYKALVILAEIAPCNDIDSKTKQLIDHLTLEEIKPENLFISSSGYYFDILELIKWLKKIEANWLQSNQSQDMEYLNPNAAMTLDIRELNRIDKYREIKKLPPFELFSCTNFNNMYNYVAAEEVKLFLNQVAPEPVSGEGLLRFSDNKHSQMTSVHEHTNDKGTSRDVSAFQI